MARALWISSLAVIVACGNVRTADDFGDPIYVVQGDLQELPTGGGERYRAVFGWLSLGGQEVVDCFDQNEGLASLACLNLPIEVSATISDTAIRPVFPASFQIPLFELPPEEVLLSHEGAVLAFGGVAIYDDRNANDHLDGVDDSAVEPLDRVVASSIATDATTFVMLREGPVHPLWAVLQTFFACPDLPVGLSVVRVEYDSQTGLSCKLSRNQRVVVSEAVPGVALLLECNQSRSPIQTLVARYPAEPLPDGAVVSCQDRGKKLSFWVDEGHFCDPSRTTTYALEQHTQDSEWDITKTPPPWWPCDLD